MRSVYHRSGARPGAYLLAGLVLGLTLVSVTRSYAVTTTTVPNAAFVSYSLPAGGLSAPIGPPVNVSVLVMGNCITLGNRGIGQVAMLRVPTVGTATGFLEWVGLHSPGAAAIASGFSGTAGTDIVRISFNGDTRLEVASPATFRVQNLSAAARAGNVTLIW